MRDAGAHVEAIRAFESAYRRLDSGHEAIAPSSELEPEKDVPALEALPEADGAERCAALWSSSSTEGWPRRWGCSSPNRCSRPATGARSWTSSSGRRWRCASASMCVSAGADEQRGNASGHREGAGRAIPEITQRDSAAMPSTGRTTRPIGPPVSTAGSDTLRLALFLPIRARR